VCFRSLVYSYCHLAFYQPALILPSGSSQREWQLNDIPHLICACMYFWPYFSSLFVCYKYMQSTVLSFVCFTSSVFVRYQYQLALNIQVYVYRGVYVCVPVDLSVFCCYCLALRFIYVYVVFCVLVLSLYIYVFVFCPSTHVSANVFFIRPTRHP